VYAGVAVSLFSEIEQGKIETQTAGAEKKSFTLPATHRVRWTVRPTFIVRPAEKLELSLYPYWKLPLQGPRRVTIDGEEELDYRLDLSTAVTWSLPSDTTGFEQVSFSLKFNRYFDNIPPRLGAETLAAEQSSGLKKTIAHKGHNAAALELTIKWGS
jgi:hypothetical protein